MRAGEIASDSFAFSRCLLTSIASLLPVVSYIGGDEYIIQRLEF